MEEQGRRSENGSFEATQGTHDCSSKSRGQLRRGGSRESRSACSISRTSELDLYFCLRNGQALLMPFASRCRDFRYKLNIPIDILIDWCVVSIISYFFTNISYAIRVHLEIRFGLENAQVKA